MLFAMPLAAANAHAPLVLAQFHDPVESVEVLAVSDAISRAIVTLFFIGVVFGGACVATGYGAVKLVSHIHLSWKK